MKNKDKGMTRRDFIRKSLGFIVAAPLGVAGLSRAFGQEVQQSETSPQSIAAKSKVILVRHMDVIDAEGKVKADVLSSMLDDAVMALMDEKEAIAAWKKLIKPTDIVGIKTNAWRFLPTPPELEQAIKKRVMDAGVAEDKIGIDDRGVLRNPIFQNATALINTRPMRTHDWAGVGSLIKNYIMFTPSPPSWHDDSCANLAGLWELPQVKGKTRLNILVMLTPLFYGKGPHHFQKEYTWQYKGLIVGTDPVACDATGVRILEAKRRLYFGEERAFEVSPKHIRVADEKYNLGNADSAKIDLHKSGWTEEILI